MLILPESEIDHLSHFLLVLKNAICTERSGAVHDDLMRHLVSAFIINILLIHQNHRVCQPSSSVKKSEHKYLLLDRFLQLLVEYHNHERRLSFYADKMCITPKYLSLVVSQASGRKATDWISDFVVQEVKPLLKFSGKNIQEVAHLLHFPSQSAFGKFFKCQVGISPTEYIDRP